MTAPRPYPRQVCLPCGRKHGRRWSPDTPITCWTGACEICGQQDTTVTAPRDFGHLKEGWDR